MKQKFDVILLEEVWELLDKLDEKVKDKIIYNIDKSKYLNDPKLFKKLVMTFGNFVQNIVDFIIDYYPSGI